MQVAVRASRCGELENCGSRHCFDPLLFQGSTMGERSLATGCSLCGNFVLVVRGIGKCEYDQGGLSGCSAFTVVCCRALNQTPLRPISCLISRVAASGWLRRAG